jgi:hypothetical protein
VVFRCAVTEMSAAYYAANVPRAPSMTVRAFGRRVASGGGPAVGLELVASTTRHPDM